MSRTSRAAVTMATTFAAVAFAASPASAWVGGSISGSMSDPVVLQMGGLTVTCYFSTINGIITAGGAMTTTSASFSGCTNNSGGFATLAAQNLPWGGSLIGGTAAITGVQLAVTTSTGLPLSCIYRGKLNGYYLTTTPPVKAFLSGFPILVSGSFGCSSTAAFSTAYSYTGPGL